ncbi:MAG: DNA-3-methyladenine glycosylase 2 family protein [Saprospiraceae bacterium]|nr:DNA-3-methyladenine glycosylase 2 family protein [Saprospiraceae bacterium]
MKILNLSDFNYRLSEGDIFQVMIRSVTSQQLSTKVAETIYNRLLQFLDFEITPLHLLSKPHEELRQLGLSNSKVKYLHSVAEYFSSTENAEKDWNALSDEEIITQLTSIKGIGVWSAQMILIFHLDRPDVLPLGDLIIQNGIKNLYDLQSERKLLFEECTEIAESWRPYRSLASRYLWHAKDLIIK